MTSFATSGTDAMPIDDMSRTPIVATVNAGDRSADVRSMHDRRGGDRPDGVIEHGAPAPTHAAAVAPRIEAARSSMREAEPVHPSEPTMRSLPIDPLRAPRPAASIRPALEPARTARSVPTPEPTVVHVTIGRIDVRAVPPPPAPRPQPSAARSASPMSLEEYLSGKTRGAR